MAKGTPSGLFSESEGTFGSHTRPEGKWSATDLTLIQTTVWTIIKTKPSKISTSSPKQTAQRQKYSDCDCLWKARTAEQKTAWLSYISKYNLEKLQNLDSYRLFLQHCLNWDFITYFDEYLLSEWQLEKADKIPGYTCFTVTMGSQLDHTLNDPTWDPSILSGRII